MPNTQGYEKHATEYEQWFEDNPDVYQAEINAIKRLQPKGTGVEIGSGTGRFTAPLKISLGIEPAKAMRKRAEERGVNAVHGVAENLPLEDQSYDYAMFITSTCFLDDPQQAYVEAARILKPKGSIVVAFLEKDSELGKIYEQHKHESPFYKDATFYSYAEVTDFLEKAGFSQFQSVQTVLPESAERRHTDILPGHELGTFVVVRAEKLDIQGARSL